MNRRPLALIALAVLTGCGGSTGMSMSFQHLIPKNASVVVLRSELPPRDLFGRASTLLTEQGYSFVRVDSSALTLDTDGMPIGQSKSPLRLSVRVRPGDGGTLLEATGQTLMGPGAWGPATHSSDPRGKRAFEEMTMLFGRLPNLEISYGN